MREAGGRVGAGGIAILMGAAAVVWALASDPSPLPVVVATGCLLWSVLGGVVVARSGHRAGPLLVGVGVAGATALASSPPEAGTGPSSAAAAALAVATGAATVVLVSLPGGDLRSRPRRAVVALAVAGIAVVIASGIARGRSTMPAGPGASLGGAILAAGVVGACAALVLRGRAATGSERSKLTWPAAGAILSAGAAAVLVARGEGIAPRGGGPWSSVAWVAIGLALPVGLTVGTVRWKLFDVWRFTGYLSDYRVWTVSFVVLGAAVVVGVVVSLGVAMDAEWGSAIAIAACAVASTAVAAAVRARLQERVDRRFAQHREDPAQTLEDFAERWTSEGWDATAVRGPMFDLLGRVAPIVVVDGVDGTRFAVRTNDREIGRHTFVHGAYDLPTMEAAVRLLGERGHEVRGRSFLDVGANIGTAAIVAIRRFGASGCVAIEPAPENLELLGWNIALNGMQDLATILPVALSDHEGRLRLELSGSNAGDHRIRAGPAEPRSGRPGRRWVEVDVVRLDELIERGDIPLESLGLLWMDVQGHEGHVLSGAGKLLRSGVPIVAELWPAGLRRAGGLEAFWEAIEANYRWVVDLRAGTDERRRAAPISRLRASVEDTDDPEWFTDILLTR